VSETPERDGRTEEATPKRLADAREKGNVALSREAATFAYLAAVLLAFALLAGAGMARTARALASLLEDPAGWRLENAADAGRLLAAVAHEAIVTAGPVVAVFAVAGLAASLLQARPRLVLERIRPQVSRISPRQGWKRVFGAPSLIEFGKSLLKLGAVIGASVVTFRAVWREFQSATLIAPEAVLALAQKIAVAVTASLLAIAGALLLADLVLTRWQWRRGLRMTRQEIKDEHKEMEGDALLKARRRSIARDRARRRMLSGVPRATVVVTNPTHYAVALRYVRAEGGAPRVVAKGQDLIALAIRDLAKQHEIPVVEDKALARSLYARVEVDQVIPAEFYRAVAEILILLKSRKTVQAALR
jgi:flagellar biosynthetic protein FlhB